ncbi:hypothetical protein [Jatrophihabitans sp.]|uniref:hypothetical protein n=1 Tax=Jatrophihabitans sp. TaxID=1932789 RepID=UPI0030C68A30
MSATYSFSLNAILAGICWVLAVVCVVVDLLGWPGWPEDAAVLFAGAGAVQNVRGMLARQEEREARAFELGRRSVRSIH